LESRLQAAFQKFGVPPSGGFSLMTSGLKAGFQTSVIKALVPTNIWKGIREAKKTGSRAWESEKTRRQAVCVELKEK
jgi:hypothetical protein